MVKESNLLSLPAADSESNKISNKESSNEPYIPTEPQIYKENIELNSRQLDSSSLYTSVISAQPYDSVISLTCTSPEHYKLQEDREKEIELEMKKDFNDVSKLKADQKKSMQRAKDLLKAAFSESESESEDSEAEDGNQSVEKLGEIMGDSDTNMT